MDNGHQHGTKISKIGVGGRREGHQTVYPAQEEETRNVWSRLKLMTRTGANRGNAAPPGTQKHAHDKPYGNIMRKRWEEGEGGDGWCPRREAEEGQQSGREERGPSGWAGG